MRFNHLDMPHQWQQYWSRYPEGYTLMEALVNWVSQVDSLVDNVNNWNDYMDDFVKTFDKEMRDNVEATLTEWKDLGLLDAVINQAVFKKAYWYSFEEFPKIVPEQDDSPRLRRAIEQIRDGKGTLLVPEGTFYVSDITLPSYITIQGAGVEKTIFKQPNNSNKDMFVSDGFNVLKGTNSNGGVIGLHLSNFTIDGNKDYNSLGGSGLKIYGYRTILEHIRIMKCKQDGFYSEWGITPGLATDGDLMESHYYDLRTCWNDGNGIVYRGSHDSIFTDILTYLNGKNGMIVENSPEYAGNGTVLSNFHSYTNGQDGLVCKTMVIGSNVQAESNTGAGIKILAADSMLENILVYLNKGNGVELGAVGVGFSGSIVRGKSFSNELNQVQINTDYGSNVIDIVTYVSEGQGVIGGTPSKDSKVNILIGGNNTSGVSHVNYEPKAGAKATTPGLPAGTGIANAVENTNRYPVFIYLFNQDGVVLVERDGTEKWLGNNGVVYLAPKEKVYFFTKVPDEWHWYGL